VRTVQARLLAGSGDRLLLLAHYGPLAPLLTLSVRPESLQVLLPRQDAYLAGPALLVGERAVPAAVAGRWLRSLLEPWRLPRLLERVTETRSRGRRVLRGRIPETSLAAEVWLDAASGRPLRWAVDDPSGRRLLLVVYPREAWRGGRWYPTRLQLALPGEGWAATVEVTRLRARPAPPPRRFRLETPPGAEPTAPALHLPQQ
jgi:hypothetical protein